MICDEISPYKWKLSGVFHRKRTIPRVKSQINYILQIFINWVLTFFDSVL